MSQSLSTRAVAKHLGFCDATIRKWLAQGALKGGRTPGGHWRIRSSDLREFKRRHGLGADDVDDKATEKAE